MYPVDLNLELLESSPLIITEGPFTTTIADLTRYSKRVTVKIRYPLTYCGLKVVINFYPDWVGNKGKSSAPYYTYRIEDMYKDEEKQIEELIKQVNTTGVTRLILLAIKKYEEYKKVRQRGLNGNPFQLPRKGQYFLPTTIEKIPEMSDLDYINLVNERINIRTKSYSSDSKPEPSGAVVVSGYA